MFSTSRPKVVLIILDGWGLAPNWGGNAISIARTPCFDELWRNHPRSILSASGQAVGLPGHERGNSEAGHLNIGAGKIVHQDVGHISSLIKDGSFFKNEKLEKVFLHVKKYNSSLQLMGLVSNGGIHSHIEHLFALLDLAKKYDLKKVYIHAFLDGRDTPPTDALSQISNLLRKIKEIKLGEIVTLAGRYYGMDRDKRWERTERAYQAIAYGIGDTAKSPLAAISQSYKKGLTDEFILPAIIEKDGKPFGQIKNNDTVIFFNVRGDRARQLTYAIIDPNFREFKTEKFKNLLFLTFTWYGEEIKNTDFIFPPEEVKKPLAFVLSKNGLKQFHLAETEKYAQVTYFLNGGREESFPLEDRKMIPSPKVATYDLKPEMSALKITQTVLEKMKNYNFTVVNFANPDMVGHTGDFKAAVRAIEIIDKQLSKIIKKIKDLNVVGLITADHGNIEEMVNPKTGEVDTEHSRNQVPFILVTLKPLFKNVKLKKEGILADIAPTILEIMGIGKPKEMTGSSLRLK